MAVTYKPLAPRNGDTYWAAYDGESYLGTVRDSLGRGDNFHAVFRREVKGKLPSRYFGSRHGAGNWLRRKNIAINSIPATMSLVN